MNNAIEFSDLETDFAEDTHTSVKTVSESIHHWKEDRGSASKQGAIYEEKCTDCRGRGRFISWAGRDVGPCFKCDGTGTRKFRTSPEQRAKARNAAAKRKEAKQEKASAKFLAWLEKNKAEYHFLVENSDWSDFYRDMRDSAMKFGSLTEKQIAAVRKGMLKKAERDIAQAKKTSEAPVVSAIVEALNKAKENGLKRPRLTFGDLAISLAPDSGRNAGFVYIKHEGEYMGKITPEGKFLPLRSCPDEVVKKVAELNEGDLMEKAKAYGIETGTCCCCNRELTDPVSVSNGIGPICEGRFF